MTKIEKLSELCSIVKRGKSYEPEALVVDILTEEAIDEVFDSLPKLLAFVSAYDDWNKPAHGDLPSENLARCRVLESARKALDEV